MREMALRVLGPPRLFIDGRLVTIPRRKVTALLVYLAVTGSPHSREALAELLYPTSTRERTASNFRVTLSLLSAIVGDDVLTTDHRSIGLPPGAHLWVDVHEFDTQMEQIRRAAHTRTGPEIGPCLESALSLYGGEFLSGFYLRHNRAFEEWQLAVQRRLADDYLVALRAHLEVLEAGHENLEAIECARSILTLDPYDEPTHRTLIALYGRTDNLSAARRQFESCTAALEDLGVEPEEETLQIMENAVAGENRVKPAARSAVPAEPLGTARLPKHATSFVGRACELEAVQRLLRQTGTRLVTLTGTGGIGKTRLATEAASALEGAFSDGMVFVDLTSVRDSSQVLPAVAAALRMREEAAGARSLMDMIETVLREKELLLILDNFEHVLDAARDVAELVQRVPTAKLLVTSRERLHLQQERVFVVPPMSVPTQAEPVSDLESYDAVRLFVDRAAAIQPGFSATRVSLSAIAATCARLDGLPLAIELAVSRLRVLSPHELLRRIDDRVGLLKSIAFDVPDRQRTIRGELDWSFQLLSQAERLVFLRLSVFAGGCTLDAIEAVSSPLGIGEAALVDCLDGLLDKNLVQRRISGAQSRYWMLETVHDYAATVLQERGDAEAAAAAHAAYYVRWSECGAEKLHGPEQMEWLARFEEELGNVDRALEWCISSRALGPSCRLGVAVSWALYRLGRVGLSRMWLERIRRLSVDHWTGDNRAGDDSARHARDEASYARALDALGWTVFVQGDWARARTLYEESLGIARSTWDREGEAIALADLGVVERWLGDTESGTRSCEQAIAIARELGNPHRLSNALIWAYATTGGTPATERQQAGLMEALRLSERIGDGWTPAHAQNGLADLYRATGRLDEAIREYEAALRGFRSLEDRWLTAWTLDGLGRTGHLMYDFERAAHSLLEAAELFLGLGDSADGAAALVGFAAAERRLGNHASSARTLAAVTNAADREDTDAEIDPEFELSAVCAECRRSQPEEWRRGLSLTLSELVAQLSEAH